MSWPSRAYGEYGGALGGPGSSAGSLSNTTPFLAPQQHAKQTAATALTNSHTTQTHAMPMHAMMQIPSHAGYGGGLGYPASSVADYMAHLSAPHDGVLPRHILQPYHYAYGYGMPYMPYAMPDRDGGDRRPYQPPPPLQDHRAFAYYEQPAAQMAWPYMESTAGLLGGSQLTRAPEDGIVMPPIRVPPPRQPLATANAIELEPALEDTDGDLDHASNIMPSNFQNTSAENVAFAIATGFPTRSARCVVVMRLGGRKLTMEDLANFGSETATKSDDAEDCSPLEDAGQADLTVRALSEAETGTLINLSQLHVHMTRNNEIFRDWRKIRRQLSQLHRVELGIKQITNKYRNEMFRLLRDHPKLMGLMAPPKASAMLRGQVGKDGIRKVHGRYNPDEWHRFTEAELDTLSRLADECLHTSGLRSGRRDWARITAEFNLAHNTDVNAQCLQNKLAGILKRSERTTSGAQVPPVAGKRPRPEHEHSSAESDDGSSTAADAISSSSAVEEDTHVV